LKSCKNAETDVLKAIFPCVDKFIFYPQIAIECQLFECSSTI
jgi:hypothetical protein